jgi:hypothetical protein
VCWSWLNSLARPSQQVALPRAKGCDGAPQIRIDPVTRLKLSLKTSAHLVAIQSRKTFDRLQRFVLAVHDETGHSVLDNFGHGAAPKRNYCVPHAIASIITKPNGSGQSIGNRRAAALAKETLLGTVVNLPNDLDLVTVN